MRDDASVLAHSSQSVGASNTRPLVTPHSSEVTWVDQWEKKVERENEGNQNGGTGSRGAMTVLAVGCDGPFVSMLRTQAAEEIPDAHVGLRIGRQHDYSRSQSGKYLSANFIGPEPHRTTQLFFFFLLPKGSFTRVGVTMGGNFTHQLIASSGNCSLWVFGWRRLAWPNGKAEAALGMAIRWAAVD